MNVFEDGGYFCVDNLPPEMIRGLVELFMHEGSKVARAAVVSDVRGGEFFETLVAALDDLDAAGGSRRLLFLDADEQTLLNRYKETRRRHPLSPQGSIAAGIAQERALLEPLRTRADAIVDTTGLKAHDLRRRIAQDFLPRQTRDQARGHLPVLRLQAWARPRRRPALRRAVPAQPALRARAEAADRARPRGGRVRRPRRPTGRVLRPAAPRSWTSCCRSTLPRGRPTCVGIGCTGGRHRSIAIAEAPGRALPRAATTSWSRSSTGTRDFGR